MVPAVGIDTWKAKVFGDCQGSLRHSNRNMLSYACASLEVGTEELSFQKRYREKNNWPYVRRGRMSQFHRTSLPESLE